MTAQTNQRSPVSTSGYRGWIVGSIASTTGDAAFNVALSWAATSMGATAASWILATPGIVSVVCLIFAGFATDHYSAKRVLTWASGFFALGGAAITLVSFFGHLSYLWLLGFAVVIGLRAAIYSPASVTLTRQLVAPERFGNALSLRQVITQLASVLGRPLGGALVALGGLGAAAVFLMSTYVISFGSVVRTKTGDQSHPDTTPDNSPGKLFGGIAYVSQSKLMSQLVIVTGLAAGLILPIPTLLVPVWARQNSLGVSAVGWMAAVMAASAIGVALVVSNRGPRRRLGLTATIGIFIAGAGALAFATSSFGVVLAACAVVGVGQGLFMTHAAPLVKAVPAGQMGKVQAIITMAQTLAISAGTLALGGLASLIKTQAAVYWGLGIVVVAVVAIVLTTFRRSTAN